MKNEKKEEEEGIHLLEGIPISILSFWFNIFKTHSYYYECSFLTEIDTVFVFFFFIRRRIAVVLLFYHRRIFKWPSNFYLL